VSDWEFLEHTGDVIVRVRGRSLGELFSRAALALGAYVYGEPAPTGERSSELVSVTAGDREALLVEWLSRILFLMSVKRARPVVIQPGAAEARHFEATVEFAAGVPEDEIKAVTWHGLAISEHGGEYTATVTCDL